MLSAGTCYQVTHRNVGFSCLHRRERVLFSVAGQRRSLRVRSHSYLSKQAGRFLRSCPAAAAAATATTHPNLPWYTRYQDGGVLGNGAPVPLVNFLGLSIGQFQLSFTVAVIISEGLLACCEGYQVSTFGWMAKQQKTKLYKKKEREGRGRGKQKEISVLEVKNENRRRKKERVNARMQYLFVDYRYARGGRVSEMQRGSCEQSNIFVRANKATFLFIVSFSLNLPPSLKRQLWRSRLIKRRSRKERSAQTHKLAIPVKTQVSRTYRAGIQKNSIKGLETTIYAI